ncbi:tyrosine-type recombinase/integrase [Novosphingobium sp. PhB57]|uniref:tyrosine-type recombinase/integrase n=1 Tax=Novosphingobium sp. PhB57 TaxID=2485107 RepID=UPI001FB3B6B1|nr:tyrosine-type recombinase/integrase [Novosphingobium sp. PhB57]
MLALTTDDLGADSEAERAHLNGNVARRKSRVAGIIWDTDLAGFGMRHSPSGAKRWIVQYRYRSSTRRAVLGKVGELSATDARKAAKALLADAALDGLPDFGGRKRAGDDIEFHAFAQLFWNHFSPRWKPTTQRANRYYIANRLVATFGDLRLRAIERSDVIQWRDSMSRLTGAFNRAIPILSVMLGYAETLGYREIGSNPCRGVPRFKRKPMERYLSAREYAQLATALCETQAALPDATAAVRILLYTGARRSEVAALRWEWIGTHFADLPDSKTGPKRLYLNRPAIDVLDRLGRETSGAVFGDRLSRARLDKHWQLIRERAGLRDVRLHDLRHSFASVAIGRGISLAKLGGILGHELPETTARYAHLADELVHEAAARVSHSMARALGVAI